MREPDGLAHGVAHATGTPADRLLLWGLVGLAAQAAFMIGWVTTETWQRPRYGAVNDTISDMQAATAPHVWFPIVCFAIGGLGSFAFLIFGLRPATAAAGRVGIRALWALALSLLALGNSFPLIPCQLSDPGCTASSQLNSVGGTTDAILATLAFLVVAATPKLLWSRLQLLPEWRSFAPVTRAAMVACPAGFLLLCASSLTNVAEGLAERLLVTICVLWLASLALHHIAITRSAIQHGPQ
jgi:hypothetical protein